MEYLVASYGSNLNLRQLFSRCKEAKVMGRGIISNYTLTFQGRAGNAYCNILKCSSKSEKKSYVPVVICKITENDLRHLDTYEGYPRVYDRITVPVKVSEMESLDCMVYTMAKGKDIPFNLPSIPYFDTVLVGYADSRFPPDPLYEALANSLKKVKSRG